MLGYMGNKIKVTGGIYCMNTAIEHKSIKFFCKRTNNKYFRLHRPTGKMEDIM